MTTIFTVLDWAIAATEIAAMLLIVVGIVAQCAGATTAIGEVDELATVSPQPMAIAPSFESITTTTKLTLSNLLIEAYQPAAT